MIIAIPRIFYFFIGKIFISPPFSVRKEGEPCPIPKNWCTFSMRAVKR
jgi:hypothetical protein